MMLLVMEVGMQKIYCENW